MSMKCEAFKDPRFNLFNAKIDYFKEHPKYEWLRKFADEAIDWYDGYANRILQIKAEDFVERIEKMPFDYIEDWLDGKNQLEWKPEWQRKEKQ